MTAICMIQIRVDKRLTIRQLTRHNRVVCVCLSVIMIVLVRFFYSAVERRCESTAAAPALVSLAEQEHAAALDIAV